MRWDYLFNAQVLERGREYFQSGRVGELFHRGATYQAKVTGSKIYDVEVYLTDRVHPRLYCNCKAASEYGNCKHMAAVLYAIAEEEGKGTPRAGENRKKEEKNVPRRIYPFSHSWTLLDDGTAASRSKEDMGEGYETSGELKNSPDEYEYFDLKEIRKDIIFYEDSCQAALKLIKEGRLVLESLRVGYPDEPGASELVGIAGGIVRAGNGAGTEEWVEVCFDKEKIRYATCSVRKCYYNYHHARSLYDYGISARKRETKPCPHVIGLLLLLQKRLREEAVGDATDSYAQRMLYGFRNLRTWNSVEKEPDKMDRVVLEPLLDLDFDGLKLGARIGKDRLYQVKSLPLLVSGAETKGRLSLGTSITHSN